MFHCILFAVLLFVYLCHTHSKVYQGNINAQAIVELINNDPHSTWKADTYGMKTINARDFARQRLGVIKENNELRFLREKIQQNNAPASGSDPPDTFSWLTTNRTKCKMDRIGEQSNCGSGWAFAAVSAFTDRLCLATNGSMTEPLSVEHVISCNTRGSGCRGNYVYYAYQFLRLNGTITGGDYDSDEGCQPYSIRPCGFFYRMPCASNYSYTPKCKGAECTNDWHDFRSEETKYKISKDYYLSAYYTDFNVRSDIYNYGPITSTMSVYSDFIFYKKGVYSRSYAGEFLGYQDVKVIGWGYENGYRYWLAANSWGTGWGENGFFKIRRGYRECGIEYYFQAVVPNTTVSEF